MYASWYADDACIGLSIKSIVLLEYLPKAALLGSLQRDEIYTANKKKYFRDAEKILFSDSQKIT